MHDEHGIGGVTRRIVPWFSQGLIMDTEILNRLSISKAEVVYFKILRSRCGPARAGCGYKHHLD